jgi:hypothetical protein
MAGNNGHVRRNFPIYDRTNIRLLLVVKVLTLSILIRKGGIFFAVKTYFEADPTT